MVQFSSNVDDVLNNLLRIQDYASGTSVQQRFHFDRIYNAEHQVCYYTPDGPLFAPIKWCGAIDNDIDTYFDNNKRISQEYQRAVRRSGFVPIDVRSLEHNRIYRDFLDYCTSYGFKTSEAGFPHSNSRARTFWINPSYAISNTNLFPDQIDEDGIDEGAKTRVYVNRYERSSKARLSCIAHHGWNCSVCNVDFVQRYGPVGRDFIHVHHLIEISKAGGSYRVDPIHDLRPVCPNCHSMIHRRNPAYSIDELKEFLRQQ